MIEDIIIAYALYIVPFQVISIFGYHYATPISHALPSSPYFAHESSHNQTMLLRRMRITHPKQFLPPLCFDSNPFLACFLREILLDEFLQFWIDIIYSNS